MEKSEYCSNAYVCITRSKKDNLLSGLHLMFSFCVGVVDGFEYDPSAFIDEYLQEAFEHTTLVERRDPEMSLFYHLDDVGLCDIRIMDKTDLRSIGQMVFDDIAPIITESTNGKAELQTLSIADACGRETITRKDGI